MPRNDYPMALMAECRRLREAGWTGDGIHRLLQARGLDPCPNRVTVYRWIAPDYATGHRTRELRRHARRAAAAANFRLGGETPEYRAAFMSRLYAEGVPPGSIAKVHRVVFGAPISPATVRRMVGVKS